ncbi:hypothetical protein NIES2109_01550 [Nostoc sp. HK-01]|nr:hypothetical protein NIES2109_01550 [Nostoc sp. HK-01]
MIGANLKSKAFGDYAVSLCVTYLLSEGYQVLMPFGDRGHYDLVSEKDGSFQRIQSKYTTGTSDDGYFRVSLQVCGSYKKDESNIARTVVHKYSANDFDALWVVTPDSCYLVPSQVLFANGSVGSIKFYPKWDIYKVVVPVPFQAQTDDGFDTRKYKRRLTVDDKAQIDKFISEGISQREVAQILEINRGTVNTYLCRKRKANVNTPYVSGNSFS